MNHMDHVEILSESVDLQISCSKSEKIQSVMVPKIPFPETGSEMF